MVHIDSEDYVSVVDEDSTVVVARAEAKGKLVKIKNVFKDEK